MSSSWTPKPLFCGEGWYMTKVKTGTIFVLCLFALSACGPLGSNSASSDSPAPPTATASSPAASNTSATSSNALPALNMPPGSAERPPPIGTTGVERTPDGLPALQPLKGLNNTDLFAQELGNADDRMSRIENAVQELRNDFDKITPSIVRLIAIEEDIQNLIKQLESLLTPGRTPPPVTAAPVPVSPAAPQSASRNTSSSAPALADGEAPVTGMANIPSGNVSGAPMPITVTPPAQASPPAPPPQTTQAKPAAAPAASGAPVVADIRVGEHSDKTRIVLDVTKPTSFTADLDNEENILLVELPGAHWSAPMREMFKHSKTLKSYSVEKTSDSSTLLILQLKTNASIIYRGSMKGVGGQGQRLIIDLALQNTTATQ